MSKLFHFTTAALKAACLEWFLLGFRHSGKGFHGEIYDETKYPALRALLKVEFHRVWNRRNHPLT